MVDSEDIRGHPATQPRSVIGYALWIVRWMVPAAIGVIGLIAVFIGHGRNSTAAAGVVLMGSALIVATINWLFRLSVESNVDREREEMAREYFDIHGRWPDEEE
jgi:ABC-type glycerol-3-phosphate transport system permease component